MKCEDKKRKGECLFKPSNYKVWFIDNQWFNFLLTVILDNSVMRMQKNNFLFINFKCESGVEN